jgi:hypothetical protein
VKWLIGALVLIALGGAGGYFGRPLVEPMVGGAHEIEAQVVSERTEDARLVLTLRVGDETMLATFRNRVEDVAELVQPGDTITIRMRSSGVFADDAPIVRVSHPPSTDAAGADAVPGAEEAAVVAPDTEQDAAAPADAEAPPPTTPTAPTEAASEPPAPAPVAATEEVVAPAADTEAPAPRS